MKFLVLFLLGLSAVQGGYVYRTASPLVHPAGAYYYNNNQWASPFYRTYSPLHQTYYAAPNPTYFKYGYTTPHETKVVQQVATPVLKTLDADVVAAAPAAVVPAAVPVAAAPSPADLVAAKTYAPSYVAQSQYHEQNEAGEYNFGYLGDTSSRQETRTADGIVRGQYSYLDSNNIPQQVNYIADGLGFRVQATNLPVDVNNPAAVAPAVAVAAPVAPVPVLKSAVLLDEHNPHVPYTPDVAHARAQHFRALHEAHTRSKRSTKGWNGGWNRSGSWSRRSAYSPVRRGSWGSWGRRGSWGRKW